MPGVAIKTLTKRYGDVAAVEELSLDVKPGEFVSLLGPSGFGKTTTLRLVAGFLRPEAGVEPEILLLDEPLSNLDANLCEEMRFEIRRLHEAFGIRTLYVTHAQAEAMVRSRRGPPPRTRRPGWNAGANVLGGEGGAARPTG